MDPKFAYTLLSSAKSSYAWIWSPHICIAVFFDLISGTDLPFDNSCHSIVHYHQVLANYWRDLSFCQIGKASHDKNLSKHMVVVVRWSRWHNVAILTTGTSDRGSYGIQFVDPQIPSEMPVLIILDLQT